MLATHNQNVQHRAGPLDDADDSFAGVCNLQSNIKLEFQTMLKSLTFHLMHQQQKLQSSLLEAVTL